MSKHDFSAQEFASRLARTRAAIDAAGLDWLLVFHPVSIHWLTGSDAKSYQEFQCLFVSADDKPLTVLARQGEGNEFRDDALVDEIHLHGGGNPQDPIAVFEQLAKVLFGSKERIGMEVPAYYLHPHHYTRIREFLGNALVAEPTNLIADLKMVKSAMEICYIREASRIADVAMEVFANALREGRTELEIAGEVYHSLLSSGSGLPASPINFVSGERGCFSHGAPTARILRQGDFGNVEFGAAYKRYTSTIGRQFCLGKPSPRMHELYNAARRASDACIAEIRAGVSAAAPHEAAKKLIEEAGLEHGRVHLSGYGLAPGFPPSWAEPVHLFGDSEYILQAGMVLTVEPPVFPGDEYLGARIIDNVIVTENGAELLSRFGRDLIRA
jgi:Xaa-Pro dipeptidase